MRGLVASAAIQEVYIDSRHRWAVVYLSLNLKSGGQLDQDLCAVSIFPKPVLFYTTFFTQLSRCLLCSPETCLCSRVWNAERLNWAKPLRQVRVVKDCVAIGFCPPGHLNCPEDIRACGHTVPLAAMLMYPSRLHPSSSHRLLYADSTSEMSDHAVMLTDEILQLVRGMIHHFITVEFSPAHSHLKVSCLFNV